MMRWLLPAIGLTLVFGLVLSSAWLEWKRGREGERVPVEAET